MDYAEILSSLGINFKEKSNYFIFSSPFRSDSTPSMVLYKDNGFVKDFGGDFKGPIWVFYKKLSGKDLKYDHLDWQRSIHSYKQPSASEKLNINIDIQGGAVSAFESKEALTYCYSRGMKDEFISDFGIMYSDWCRINGTPFRKRLLIPIIEHNSVISIEGRDITRQQHPKVLYPSKCSVSTLFNIDNLNRTEPLLIVEGIMDLVKIYQSISKNVTALFGVGIKERQKEILNTFPKIVIFPDNDEPGQEMLEVFGKFYEYEPEIAQVKEKDPGDAPIESLMQAYEERKSLTEYILEQTGIFSEEKVVW